MKKWIVILLCLLVAICSACERLSTAEQIETITKPDFEPDAWQKKTDRVILTLASMIHKLDDVHPVWGEDPVSREIINMTGVQIDLIRDGDPAELYMNSMAETLFLNHEKADIIVVDSENDIAKLIASGEVWAIDELAEQYCPEFWDNFDSIELENNRSGDGHIYAIRSGYRTDAYYADDSLGIRVPRNMILKMEVLEKLGESVPTSVEGLDGLLYRVQEHGEALGVDSPLRMKGPLEGPIYDWMGLPQEPVWNEAEQKVQTPYANEGWLAYFKLMNRWYRDDILKMPEPIPGDEMMTAINAENFMARTEPTGFATAYAWVVRPMTSGILYQLREGTEGHDTPFGYHLIQSPLKYQDQMQFTAADNALGDGYAVLIGKENDEERALLFLQFLMSEEGSRLTKWGIKDTHYTLSMQAELEITDSAKATAMIGTMEPLFESGVDYWDILYDPAIAGKVQYSPEYTYTNSDYLALREMQLNAERNYKQYAAENRNPVLAFAMLSPDHGLYEKYQEIEALWQTSAYDMVTAPDADEVEILWTVLQNEIQKLGLADIEATMTAQYQDALARYQEVGFFTE